MQDNPYDNISLGTLTDDDIISLGNRNFLITENFEIDRVKQTCYELRVGRFAYYLLNEEHRRRVEINAQNPVVMRPGEIVTIITYEQIRLPENILARIISKGTLFSIGLSPVITYADPGFEGNLGITFINHSRRTVRLNYLDPISKIEFEKLSKNVSHPYRGPHNYAEEIWPIDYSRFYDKRIINEENIKNKEFIKKDIAYYGEPFDLFFSLIDNINIKIKNKFILLLSLNIGIIVLIITSTFITEYKFIPLDINKKIIDVILSIISTILINIINKISKEV